MRRNQMPQPWSLAGVQSEKKKKRKHCQEDHIFAIFRDDLEPKSFKAMIWQIWTGLFETERIYLL